MYDLYLGASRRTRPLPRGVAGHVAHPIRSIQILISETLRVLLYQCSTLKPGFNGRHNHFYSSSCLRF